MAATKTPKERLNTFFSLLWAQEPASTESEAIDQVTSLLNMVEDHHSGVPYNPDAWGDDGRMYPPQNDNRNQVSANVARYRTRGHHVFVARNGAIRIQALCGQNVYMDKPGRDGRKVHDYE